MLLVEFEKASQEPIDLGRTTVATYNIHIFDREWHYDDIVCQLASTRLTNNGCTNIIS